MKKYILILIVVSILLVLGILLSTPFGLSQEVRTLGYFEQDENVTLKQTCSNCTFVIVSDVSFPNSTYALYGNYPMVKNGISYYYIFTNTSELGNYIYCGVGDIDGINKTFCVDFNITPNGEKPDISKSILYLGLLALLVIFLLICIYSFFTYDNLLNRVGMIGLGYLFFIAITFVGWQMANDFLTGSPFIASMLRILFLVFMFGTLPMLIGFFAFYTLSLIKIKEIQDLMEKGLPYEEAQMRIKNKRKRKIK